MELRGGGEGGEGRELRGGGEGGEGREEKKNGREKGREGRQGKGRNRQFTVFGSQHPKFTGPILKTEIYNTRFEFFTFGSQV